MANDQNRLAEGAGTTTGSSGTPATSSGNAATETVSRTTYTAGGTGASYGDQYRSPTYESGSEHEGGRELVLAERSSSRPSRGVVIGAALAGAVAASAIPFMLSGRSSSSRRRQDALVHETVTINRPARELYDFWRDFTNFPQFMDNIKSVEKLDEKRSHWVIKAPAGTSVEFDSRIVEDQPGRLIAWESEEGASVPNRGRVEFEEQGGFTTVRTTISYDPPAGAAGRLIAKLFQREPQVQAQQDLRRFKELMER